MFMTVISMFHTNLCLNARCFLRFCTQAVTPSVFSTTTHPAELTPLRMWFSLEIMGVILDIVSDDFRGKSRVKFRWLHICHLRTKHALRNGFLCDWEAEMDRQLPALEEQNLRSVVLVAVWSLFHRPDDIWDSEMCPWRGDSRACAVVRRQNNGLAEAGELPTHFHKPCKLQHWGTGIKRSSEFFKVLNLQLKTCSLTLACCSKDPKVLH